MDILIIDDEEIVRRTLQRYVEHGGIRPFWPQTVVAGGDPRHRRRPGHLGIRLRRNPVLSAVAP